ncbi:uncharacterized protein B0P05DRAFT_629390 [Gilbertella persicaria]|uniref:uncharacterized protein n=1 Tax=Gilbertella persicaria TaxID=101096 RepID=UPI00221EF720|nr:uncharacterized protein B0P05DRAFT_629390 [Gilbertella persicaria]KAI8090109.1 hypothetical protein B0P05DRAFT_629390 [Gilbertella persicaria]
MDLLQLIMVSLNVIAQYALSYMSAVLTIDAERQTKKLKTIDHTDENRCWELKGEEDIWVAWRQYMDKCNCHENCLEKSHIIECNYSIKCNPSTPNELYELLGLDLYKVESPFSACLNYVEEVFLSNGKIKEVVESIKFGDTASMFSREFFLFILTVFKKKLRGGIAFSEANFCHRLLWPLVEFAVDHIGGEDMSFVYGEYTLLSCDEE